MVLSFWLWAGPARKNKKAPSGSRRRGLFFEMNLLVLLIHLVPSRAHDDADDDRASYDDERRLLAKERIGLCRPV